MWTSIFTTPVRSESIRRIWRSVLTDSDASYRWTIIPLGILCTFAGVFTTVYMWVLRLPITSPAPFVRSQELNQRLFGAIGIYCLLMGIGLLLRWRIAFYAFFAYIAFGVVVRWIAAFDPEFWKPFGVDQSGRVVITVVAILFDLAIGYFVYRFGTPAFRNRSI
jgi:hypothetical protein